MRYESGVLNEQPPDFYSILLSIEDDPCRIYALLDMYSKKFHQGVSPMFSMHGDAEREVAKCAIGALIID